MVDVVVVGGGPAGRSVAAACDDTGLRVALVDPHPRRAWPRTYAGWAEDLPATVPAATVMDQMRVFGTTEHTWRRRFVVLDNRALWKRLWREGVREIRGRAVAAEHGPAGVTVLLDDGRSVAAALVVDASGTARALSGGRPARGETAQSSVGVLVDAAAVPELCPPGTGVLMDWRPAPDTRGGWPTFRFAVHLPGDRVLLRETSLARRPALPFALLRRRLQGRLATSEIRWPDNGTEQRARFPIDDPIPGSGQVVPFGAAGGLLRAMPGSGIATTLRMAPWVASAIAAGLSSGPIAASTAARSILWPRAALAADRLNRQTLRTLLTLPPDRVPEFFETYFGLDQRTRADILGQEPAPDRTAATMTAMLRQASWPLRRDLVLGGFVPRARQARHGLGGV